MSRITKTVRERIASKALKAAFDERCEQRKDAEHKLAMECYEACLPEAERTLANQLPESWLRQDSCLRFNANGWAVRFSVNKSVPVPYTTSCRNLGNLTGELAERVQAFSQSGKEINEQKWKAEAELNGFLEQFKTFKQIREAWPEGEKFYAEFDVDRPASGLPAVRTEEINKLLGIK